jgi:hypothetical protein
VGDSMQRLAMDVSGVVAFIRVTEWSRQVLKVVCGRRLPCFHHLCTAWANNPYRIIFVTVPVTGSGAREDRLVRDLCIFLSTGTCVFSFQHGSLSLRLQSPSLDKFAKLRALDEGCSSLRFWSTTRNEGRYLNSTSTFSM